MFHIVILTTALISANLGDEGRNEGDNSIDNTDKGIGRYVRKE